MEPTCQIVNIFGSNNFLLGGISRTFDEKKKRGNTHELKEKRSTQQQNNGFLGPENLHNLSYIALKMTVLMKLINLTHSTHLFFLFK